MDLRCPDPNQLAAYAHGELTDPTASEIADHVEQCGRCEATVVKIERHGDTVISGLRKQPAADPLLDEPQCQRAVELVRELGRDPATIDLVGTGGSPVPAARTDATTAHGQLREYKLLEKLGEGGMGAVYKAMHTKLKRIVALKVLPAERLQDPQAVVRFEREMEAVGKLDHPHIVRAMDAGEFQGTHFLVMEYVDGIDLSQLVKERGPLPIAAACEYVRQAAIGLQHAHEHGLVHRDIKPSNLMLSVDGSLREPNVRSRSERTTLKILDLGLALLGDKHEESPQHELTCTGQLMGTLDYMAPEQGSDSHVVDIRADIYSLGATLYKLLTGDVVYSGAQFRSPVQKMRALALSPAPDIRTRRQDVPDELAKIIAQMLEKDPEKRPRTPAEVAALLAPFVQTSAPKPLIAKAPAAKPASAPRVAPPVIAVRPSSPAKPHATGAMRSLQRSHGILPPWLLIGGVLVLAGFGAIALAATVFYFQTDKGTLRVEVQGRETEVRVQGTDIVITAAGEREPIKLRAGEHSLVVTRGDFTFETEKFELKRGETATVKVELLDGAVQVVRDGRVIGKQHVAAPISQNFALQFDPQTFAEAPIAGIDRGESFTLELRAASTMPSTIRYARLLALGALSIEKDDGAYWYANLAGESGDFFQSPSAAYREGEWMHLAAVRTKNRCVFFVNGKLIGTGEARTLAEVDNNRLQIGLHSLKFSGFMDEIRVSRGARYTADFTPAPRLDADETTIALYHCDEGEGNVLRDASPNGHHGKIVGAKWVAVDESGTHESALAQLFAPGTPTIDTDGVTPAEGGWKVVAKGGDRTAHLFELPKPGVDDCYVLYRAKVKTAGVGKRAYLEMWCVFAGDATAPAGEYFSKGFDNALTGDSDWLALQIPFRLNKGQTPDKIKLNLVIEGGGTAWIKDIEIATAPLSTGFGDLLTKQPLGDEHSTDDSAILKTFAADTPTIDRNGITPEAGGWKITATGDHAVQLFRVPDPGVDNCLVVYRAKVKTKDIGKFACLSMARRMPNDPKQPGVYITEALQSPINGTTDWTTREIFFRLEKGQTTDLILLNFWIEGGGTAWIKDVEVVKRPLPEDDSASGMTPIATPHAAYDRFATGEWVPAFAEADEIPTMPGVSFADGVVTLNDAMIRDNSPVAVEATDMIVRAQVKGIGSLATRCTGGNTTFWLGEGFLGINRNDAAGTTVLASRSYPVDLTQFHELALASVGDRQMAFVDGRRVLDAVDDKWSVRGPILIHAHQAKSEFKNIEVMSLDGLAAARLLPERDPLARQVGLWDTEWTHKVAGKPDVKKTGQMLVAHTGLADFYSATSTTDDGNSSLYIYKYLPETHAIRTWTFFSNGYFEVFDKTIDPVTGDHTVPPRPRGNGIDTGSMHFVDENAIEVRFELKSPDGKILSESIGHYMRRDPSKPSTKPSLAADGPAKEVPELAILAPFIGRWDVDVRIKPSHHWPEGEKQQKVDELSWILGGRFMKGEGYTADGQLDNIWFWHYDPKTRAYAMTMFQHSGDAPAWNNVWNERAKSQEGIAKDLPQGWAGVGGERIVDENTSESWVTIKDARGEVMFDMEATKRRK